MLSYTLCDTWTSVEVASRALSKVDTIFLDCEGGNLGAEHGSLCILSLGAIVPNISGQEEFSIFLIDAFSFGVHVSEALEPIFSLLSRQSSVVVFDGRMDASELYHGHGVRLTDVVDLQVVDIMSREKRQETLDQQLERLLPVLPRWELTQNREQYLTVHKLNGLDGALREHGIMASKKCREFVTFVIARSSHAWIEIDHDRWQDRPLAVQYLEYAAEDVQKIYLLYQNLVTSGYVDSQAKTLSLQYISQHYGRRPREGNPYAQHGILPLAIFLDDIPPNAIRCEGCERSLPPKCFDSRHHTKGRRKKKNGRKMCYVCKTIDKREMYRLKRSKRQQRTESRKES